LQGHRLSAEALAHLLHGALDISLFSAEFVEEDQAWQFLVVSNAQSRLSL
jgi:hypothetical protein